MMGLIRIAGTSALMAFTVAAGATEVLSGTFAGTSTNTQIFQGPGGNFDGTPASGSFRIDLVGCVDYASAGYPAPNCGGNSGPYDHPTTYLRLNTAEGTVVFRDPGYLAQLTNDANSQTLSINFVFMAPYSYTAFSLVGPVDAFIHGNDFSHVFGGRVDLGASSLEYQDGRSYRGAVTLTSLTVNSVPEPASWVVMAALLGVGWAAMRARKTEI